VDPELLRQVWPIFSVEAREQLAVIGGGLLQLETSPERTALLDPVRRTAHSLKGAASSLGLTSVERLAHAIEGALAGYDPGEGLGAEVVLAALDALEGIEEALAAGDAGKPPEVDGLEPLLRSLAAVSPDGPGAAAILATASKAMAGAPAPRETFDDPLQAIERALARLLRPGDEEDRAAAREEVALPARRLLERVPAHARALAEQVAARVGQLGAAGADGARAAAALAGDLVELREVLERGEVTPPPPAPPATRPGDRSVRVLASTLDGLAHRVEQLVIGEARQVRRAREAGALEASAREAMRRLDLTLQALRIAGAERERAAIEAAVLGLRGLAAGLRTMAREGHSEAEQQRLNGALLRDDLRALRMVPAAAMLEPLRIVVRELSGRLGRPVELELPGGGVRIDRRVVDELRDPLLHLVRNAVGHGIEPPEVRRAAGKPAMGRLSVRVEPRGGRIGVVVEDDGAGLDLAAIRARATERGLMGDAPDGLTDAALARLIFSPGFSTASQVTSISGRGVGLDVVLEAVTRLGGAVDVRSEPGRSTRFDLDLPLTLSAAAAILLRVGEDLAALPADAVERVVLLSAGDLQVSAEGTTARVGDRLLPHALLGTLLGLPAGAPPHALQTALVVAVGPRRAVITPDEVLGQQELLVGSLAGVAARVPHLVGAAVLDDGQIVGLLNPAELLRRIPAAGRASARRAPRALVADDAQTTRLAMKGLLEEAGFEVTVAADGAEALRLASETAPTLVVTDVEMRRVGGLELARRLKADPRLRSVPVVMITSLDSPEARAAGLAAGADAYLVKRDVARDELVALLRRLAGLA
jgi:two-component system, chemotaxis family, sensor kinase CheA